MSQGRYEKPPLSLTNQVARLLQRGMVIEDPQAAETALLHLNYYRFCEYAQPFEEPVDDPLSHRYQGGVTFHQVVRLHTFDADLRMLLFRYLEPVEIAFRTAVCYEMAIRTGNAHWHLDQDLFCAQFDHAEALLGWQTECSQGGKAQADLYSSMYCDPALPAAWIMCEILSMGRWSVIYMNIADAEAQDAIAVHFGRTSHFLKSWIHTLSVLRNLCAHHCRIWNRYFDIRPSLPPAVKTVLGGNGRLAAQIAVLTRLLDPLGQRPGFERDWQALLAAYPDVPREPMGFGPEGTLV